MACALVARGHQVTMVCGSYGLGKTGLTTGVREKVRAAAVSTASTWSSSNCYLNRDGS